MTRHVLLPGHALDILARVPLWKDGLDYRHGTGHGVGSYLNVHEGVYIFLILICIIGLFFGQLLFLETSAMRAHLFRPSFMLFGVSGLLSCGSFLHQHLPCLTPYLIGL